MFEHPRAMLDVGATMELAGDLRDRVDLEDRLFLPPREWSLLAGFGVALTVALTDDELADDRTVFYVPHKDPRERGLRVYCGLSRTYLRSIKIQHTWHDVWRFALELAVPVEAHRSGVERLSRSQPHCPVDVIRDVLAGRW